MSKIIDGKIISASVKDRVKAEVEKLKWYFGRISRNNSR